MTGSDKTPEWYAAAHAPNNAPPDRPAPGAVDCIGLGAKCARPCGADGRCAERVRDEFVASVRETMAQRPAPTRDECVERLRAFVLRKTPNNGERVAILGALDALAASARTQGAEDPAPVGDAGAEVVIVGLASMPWRPLDLPSESDDKAAWIAYALDQGNLSRALRDKAIEGIRYVGAVSAEYQADLTTIGVVVDHAGAPQRDALGFPLTLAARVAALAAPAPAPAGEDDADA